MLIFILLLNLVKPVSIINEFKKDILAREPWWKIGFQTVKDHPFSGIGLNWMRKSNGIDSTHVHNHFLHTAAELGIPALIAYLAILIGAVYMAYYVWNKSNIGWMRIAARGLACGQIAHIIFGIGDSISLGAKPGVFFWFSLGLITAIYNFTLKKEGQIQIKATK